MSYYDLDSIRDKRDGLDPLTTLAPETLALCDAVEWMRDALTELAADGHLIALSALERFPSRA